jgi:hypothetical protein
MIGSTTQAPHLMPIAKISFEARRIADEQLRQCVIRVGEKRRGFDGHIRPQP